MIKNIIFDFGGVILKHKATLMEDILLEMFPNSYQQAERIWSEHKILLNVGKRSSDDFILELKNNINTKLSATNLKEKWKELYIKEAKNVDWDLLDFIAKLRRKYYVYLFTDTIDLHDEYNKTRNIYNKFHKAFKSFEEGVAKVEGKKAYLYILKQIKAKPEETILIDDKEQNIKDAAKVGIPGIVYKNLDKLKRDFKSQGI